MFKFSFHQICLRPTMPRENILLHLQGICSSEHNLFQRMELENKLPSSSYEVITLVSKQNK